MKVLNDILARNLAMLSDFKGRQKQSYCMEIKYTIPIFN